MARYVVEVGPFKAALSSLRDALALCRAQPKVSVEGRGRGDRVEFRVRLADNILSHVLVVSELNYTYGFPLELANGLDLKTRLRLRSSGLRRRWWFVAATVLLSEASTLEELLDLLEELEQVIHDGARPSRARLAWSEEDFAKTSEAYPELGTWDEYLGKLRRDLSRDTLAALRGALRECYDNFYERYWERREGELAELASRLKRAVDVLQPLRALEETVGLRLEAERLEAFPVDVFRRGGGVYGAHPNRITCTSSECAPLSIHVDIAHEAGHLVIGGWKLRHSDSVRELASALGRSDAYRVACAIEEHVVALVQLKVDLRYYGERRVTHGYMENAAFALAERVWSEVESCGGFSFEHFIEEYLGRLRESEEAKRALAECL